ncbi:hypothetical protein KQI65_13915 [bacterium]|nr:hypothetical protein [bacterium]
MTDSTGVSVTATWLNPEPQGNTIRDMCFPDSLHGWAVGDYGTIMHTRNAGQNWEIQPSRTTLPLWGLSFCDSTHGWICGHRILLRTTDAGASWTEIPCPQPFRHTRDWPKQVHMISKDTVLLRTYYFLYLSSNNGRDWAQKHLRFSDIMHFRNPTSGLLIDGHQLHHIDNKANYLDTIQISSSGFFDMVCPTDSLYVGASINGLEISTDGGHHWRSTVPRIPAVTQIASVAGEKLFVLSNNTLKVSNDRAATWEESPHPAESALTCIRFVDNSAGYLAAHDGRMLHTTDTGVTWEPMHTSQFNIPHAVSFTSRDEGWLAGDGIFHTTDGGLHWERQNAEQDSLLYNMFFLDNTHGWIIGDSGRVQRTTDGGASWQYQHLPAGKRQGLVRVFFSDTLHGWIVRSDGVLFRSEDGGSTWHSQNLPVSFFTTGLHFADRLHGCIAGTGHILTTTDGGNIWRHNSLPDKYRVEDARILRDGTLIVLAREYNVSTVLLRSSDSGSHWEEKKIADDDEGKGLTLFGDDEIFVQCYNGEILHSMDGGVSWVTLPLPFGFGVSHFSVPERDRVFLTGHGGTILRLDLTEQAQ